MKRTRHTPEKIIRKLKTAEQLLAQGKTVADVCRQGRLKVASSHLCGSDSDPAEQSTDVVS